MDTNLLHFPSGSREPARGQGGCHPVEQLADEIRRLLNSHQEILKEEGVRRELVQLEEWLANERYGAAPSGIITQGGLAWLVGLRDRLKLSADEALRMEGEGGNPSTANQARKLDDLLKTVRRLDRIIEENTTP